MKRANVFAPETSNEVPKLQHNILASALLQPCRICFRRTNVIWSQQHDGEIDIRVVLELFDYGPAFIRLLVKNNRFDVQSL